VNEIEGGWEIGSQRLWSVAVAERNCAACYTAVTRNGDPWFSFERARRVMSVRDAFLAAMMDPSGAKK